MKTFFLGFALLAGCSAAVGGICDDVNNPCSGGSVCVYGHCYAPTCADGVRNGTESDVDCGGGSCPACQHGQACADGNDCKSAYCLGGQCASCPGGEHACSNQCVYDTSLQNCGASCTPCPAPPANASEVCSGATPSCGFACNTGYHPNAAGNGCDADTIAACGNPAVACPAAPSNATESCANGQCVYACDSGYYNDAPNHCALSNNPTACGNPTQNCTLNIPANSTAFCSSTGTCGWTCNSGYHQCGTSCIIDTSTSSCGPSAGCGGACSAPQNASPTCNGTSCGWTCNAGYHSCNGTSCVTNDVNACGSGCAVCAAPANATPTCDGTSCGFTCNPGYRPNATGGCTLNNTVSCCGVNCTDCDSYCSVHTPNYSYSTCSNASYCLCHTGCLKC